MENHSFAVFTYGVFHFSRDVLKRYQWKAHTTGLFRLLCALFLLCCICFHGQNTWILSKLEHSSAVFLSFQLIFYSNFLIILPLLSIYEVYIPKEAMDTLFPLLLFCLNFIVFFCSFCHSQLGLCQINPMYFLSNFIFYC